MRDKATKFWKKYWPKVKAGLIDAWGTVSKFCIKIWDRTVVPWLNKTGKKMAAWVKKTYEKVIVPGVNKAWRRLTKQVGKWWASILKWWRGTSKESSSWWSETWDEIKTGWNVVVKKFKEWWNDEIQPWVDKVGTVINTYWEATKELVTTWFYGKVWLNILRGWTWFTTMLKGIGLGVAAQFTAMGNFIVPWIVNKIKQLWWSFENTVTGWAIDRWSNFTINMNKMISGFAIGFNEGLIGLLKLLDKVPFVSTQKWINDLKGAGKELKLATEKEENEMVKLNAARQKANRKASVASQKVIDDMAVSIKKLEPASNAMDEAIGSAMKGFDKKHKADIDKADKALETFRDSTKGATDILFDASNTQAKASTTFKEAVDRLIDGINRGPGNEMPSAADIGNAVAAAVGNAGSPTIMPMPGSTGGSSYQNGTSQLRQLNQ